MLDFVKDIPLNRLHHAGYGMHYATAIMINHQ